MIAKDLILNCWKEDLELIASHEAHEDLCPDA